jgi:5'-nucleotidase
VKALDPNNRPIYWIGPAGAGQDAGPGTDFHAVAAGWVSVSPLKVDLTAHAALATVESWFSRFR